MIKKQRAIRNANPGPHPSALRILEAHPDPPNGYRFPSDEDAVEVARAYLALNQELATLRRQLVDARADVLHMEG